jgi:hypothetical protein
MWTNAQTREAGEQMTDEPEDDKLSRWIDDLRQQIDAIERDIQRVREVWSEIYLNPDNEPSEPSDE